MFKRLIDDYHVTMFLGVMFIVSGLMAAANDVIEVYTGFKVNLFHSMIFLGVFNCCMAVVFMILGARNVEAGEEAAKQREKTAAVQKRAVDNGLEDLETRVRDLEAWRKGQS